MTEQGNLGQKSFFRRTDLEGIKPHIRQPDLDPDSVTDVEVEEAFSDLEGLTSRQRDEQHEFFRKVVDDLKNRPEEDLSSLPGLRELSVSPPPNSKQISNN